MTHEIWLIKAHRNLKTAALALADDDTATACNRSYYAIFWAARAALLVVGQSERSYAKTHTGLISSFSEFLIKTGDLDVRLARMFSTEASRRLLCDYQDGDVSHEDSTSAISNATEFVMAIEIWIEAQTLGDSSAMPSS